MYALTLAVATGLLAATGAVAAPTSTAAAAAAVTNYPITSGCSKFPGYSAGSNTTDPFILQFVQSPKAPVNNFGLVTLDYDDDTHGRYALPASNDLAKTVSRCNQAVSGPNGSPSFEVLTGGSWLPLQIFAPATGFAPNAGNARLVYGATTTPGVDQLARAYTHDKAGTAGIFIGGADKNSNFAASLEYSANDIHRSFYNLRYVPTGGSTLPTEYTGYVQVYGS